MKIELVLNELHRISCIRNRQFLINGLTCRIGRAVFGTISVVRDLLESEKSIFWVSQELVKLLLFEKSLGF
jgi:stage III sporulation protein SpoIIIAA